ncbi:hypothetical protein [Stenotrophomonas oahuensis]|uniref:Uncharacterized protein n=1 Tax=Stenotrophomonas oahuensis TaxID=3003271 RepID=A0ABY9YPQ4_9GAMM|nr:hypothetical protein [Stenotrophomonas sp. A5586]WNH52199.1 hypothetical protein PDM29_17975 [Stenotrophomonas sp. A5586]
MRCLLLCCLPLTAVGAPLLRFEGVAATADGAVAYREVHWQQGSGEGAQRLVQYLCPDGQPFARKEMPATPRPLARGYTLQDRRSGQLAQVRVSSDMVGIDWKEDAQARAQLHRIALPADAVVDAGFDAAVRAHWQSLLQGTPLRLPFLVPGRGRFYPVTVVHRGPVRWQGQTAQTFEVRLDTWYGGLAPRLSLVYSGADRRLLEFRGTSNLRDAAGKYSSVVVRFNEPARAQPMERWDAVLRQPLVANCPADAP